MSEKNHLKRKTAKFISLFFMLAVFIGMKYEILQVGRGIA